MLQIPALVTGILTVVAALAALYFYSKQASAATRDHLNNVHQLVFERLDAPEIRAARHYVYDMDSTLNATGEPQERGPLDTENLAYELEHWLTLDRPGFAGGSEEQLKTWRQHKANAEIVARAFDQLGYLVREGIVPLNVIARFYSYPALRCWYKLSPYVGALRRARHQFGHMWEWQNLVQKIIRGASTKSGIWKGAIDHDNLQDYADKIQVRTGRDFPNDDNWAPPDRSWVC